MRVGIIGMGYVGGAVASSLPSDITVCYDPIVRPYCDTSFDDIKSCEAVVICVPTPVRYDGSCNTSIIHSTLEKLNEGTPFEGVIISKSTATPDFYANMIDRYPNLVHVPEFLRASTANEDYLQSSFALYGGHEQWTELASKVLTQGQYNPSSSLHTDIKTASLYKYLSNSYLATKVVWMNEFKSLADSLGVEWADLQVCFGVDKRIGITHTSVPGPDGKFGYGGACFPKDISAIMSLGKAHNVELSVLEQVVAKNDKIR